MIGTIVNTGYISVLLLPNFYFNSFFIQKITVNDTKLIKMVLSNAIFDYWIFNEITTSNIDNCW